MYSSSSAWDPEASSGPEWCLLQMHLLGPKSLALEPFIPLHTTTLLWEHDPPFPALLPRNFTMSLVGHMRKLCLCTLKILNPI